VVEIINLNRARKARDKDAAKATAAHNRVAHGRTRAERDAQAAERQRVAKLLDGARRDD